MSPPSGSGRETVTRPERNRHGSDPAPSDDKITGIRADYAPVGADTSADIAGTLKRTLKESSEDNLTDWAASLTYYGLLAIFPALLALLSIVGLLVDPQKLTDALTAVVPAAASDTLAPVIEQISENTAPAGIGLIGGLAGAIWSASGYVGAFTRAANVIYETPEGRKIWKLKPLQLLITLIGVILTALVVAAVVLSGPVVEAVGQAVGLDDTILTIWNVAKWPVIVVIVALMIAGLYYATPNVRLRGFRFVSPGATAALIIWAVASALFAFYVANFGSYNATYETLAGVIIFLVWLWLTNLALLLGLQLDAEIERSKELKEGVPRAEKEIQLDAREDPKDQQTT